MQITHIMRGRGAASAMTTDALVTGLPPGQHLDLYSAVVLLLQTAACVKDWRCVTDRCAAVRDWQQVQTEEHLVRPLLVVEVGIVVCVRRGEDS